jgi:hypothetical protein
VRKADVAVAEAAGVVRRKDDFHPVVDVEELGMMVHFFGQQRHSRHETPSFGKVAEMITLADRIAVLDLDPPVDFA